MFTSIAKLRASHADQSRVTAVENALKKRCGSTWLASAPFPIAFILISNSQADFNWVVGTSSVFLKPTGFTAAKQVALVKSIADAGLKPWDSTVSKTEAEKLCTLIANWCTANGISTPFSLAFPLVKDAAIVARPTSTAPMKQKAAEAIAAPIKKAVAKRPFGGKGTVAMLKKPAGSNTPTANFTGVKKAINVGGTVTGRTASVKVPVAAKPSAKPLPVPSVLKQIRDLVKGHPKLTLEENKGPNSQMVITEKRLVKA